MGYCHRSSGRGVKKSHEHAAENFMAAAEQGHAPSQFSLAKCYEYKLGVRRSNYTATVLCSQAASQGHLKAQDAVVKYEAEYRSIGVGDILNKAAGSLDPTIIWGDLHDAA